MSPAIIACDVHDHVEIICMRRYPVIIHQLDGQSIQAVARDTRSTANEEFLVVALDGQKIDIPLLQIERIEVLDPGAPLQEIWLQQGNQCAI